MRKENAVVDESTGVVEAITRLENFLPMMLKLPSHLLERASTLPILVDLVTKKVTLWQGLWVVLFVDQGLLTALLEFWDEAAPVRFGSLAFVFLLVHALPCCALPDRNRAS